MPRYRNAATGVVVNLPAEKGDALRGYEPVTSEAQPQAEAPTRRRRSTARD